jgi:hypothetical protein
MPTNPNQHLHPQPTEIQKLEEEAILLFDEADTLFNKRSEVKDSHDRYANDKIDPCKD